MLRAPLRQWTELMRDQRIAQVANFTEGEAWRHADRVEMVAVLWRIEEGNTRWGWVITPSLYTDAPALSGRCGATCFENSKRRSKFIRCRPSHKGR